MLGKGQQRFGGYPDPVTKAFAFGELKRSYHESRTHLNLGNQCPFPREALKLGKIVAIPQLVDLHR